MIQTENQFVCRSIENIINENAGKRIGIYGTGGYTVYALEHLPKGLIAGLMDPVKQGSEFMGYPVVTIEQAIGLFDIVIIVARESVIPIIYERLHELEEAGIEILDMVGRTLSNRRQLRQIEANPYWEKSLEGMKAEIDRYEWISFDIFDTLLARMVLHREDLFDVMEKCIAQEMQLSLEFSRLRVSAEKAANEEYGAARLEEIYEKFAELTKLDSETIYRISDMELAMEQKYCCVRKVMREVFFYAKERGKHVLIIADTCYSEQYIRELLAANGIDGYEGLVLSCKERASKGPDGNLYQCVLQEPGVCADKWLHIGANAVADDEVARKCGIETYPVYSPYEMFRQSKFAYLEQWVKTVEDHVVMGMILARLLNNPFALNAEKGTIRIEDIGDLGYTAIGCQMLYFCIWLLKMYKNTEYDKILFMARDGYLPQKLYDKIANHYHMETHPESVYVLASRRAVSVAGIENEEDVQLNASLLCLTTPTKLKDVLFRRYGVVIEHDAGEQYVDVDEFQQLLPLYEQMILKEAAAEREEYLKYLEELGIGDTDSCLIVDAGIIEGTVPFWFEKLLKKSCRSACITLINAGKWSLADEKKTDAFLGMDYYNVSRYRSTTAHDLVECFFTAPDAQLVKIEAGIPVYSDKEWAQLNLEELTYASDGILSFVDDYLRLVSYDIESQQITNNLSDELVGCVGSRVWDLSSDIDEMLYIMDTYGTGLSQNGGRFEGVKLK